VRWVDWPKFMVMLAHVSWWYVASGGVFYAGVYVARAIRMRALIPQTRFLQMFWINTAHYFFNKIMPARTGELTLPMLIKRYTAVSFGQGMATLLLLRYMDVIVIMLILLVSLFLVPATVVLRFRGYAWVLVLGILILMAGFILLPRLARKITKLKKLIPETNYTRFVWTGLRDTLCAWLCLYAYLFCLVQSLHLQFGFWAVAFAGTFSILTIVLPVSAIGNFGTFEAGWVLGFVMLGMNKGDALAAGFFTNVVLTILNAVLALIGIMVLECSRKRGLRPQGV
jgi:uncharacterized membrane protein YbhN (UPF0104 family)